MNRISIDEWGLLIAEATALRGTCLRRAVGCFLVDRRGNELAMGRNGAASGLPHCNEMTRVLTTREELRQHTIVRHTVGSNIYPHACPGAQSKSGEDLDRCEAIHAEANALMKCHNVHAIETCYVTVSPCVSCVKMLMNTSCRRIVFREAYAHDAASRELWSRTGREWIMRPRGVVGL